MTSDEGERRRSRRTRWHAPFLAGALLVSSVAVATAQQATDTGTISVSVLPPGGSLTISADDPPSFADVAEAPSGMLAPSAQGPATVSAMVWLPDETAIVPGTEVAPTMIIVRDERGTGAGWDVVLTATDETGGWDPVLQGNTPATITRVLPVAEPAQGGDAVSAGGTSSDLRASTAVLRADEGGGAGVFTQVLTIVWPDSGGGPGLVSIQLPFAP